MARPLNSPDLVATASVDELEKRYTYLRDESERAGVFNVFFRPRVPLASLPLDAMLWKSDQRRHDEMHNIAKSAFARVKSLQQQLDKMRQVGPQQQSTTPVIDDIWSNRNVHERARRDRERRKSDLSSHGYLQGFETGTSLPSWGSSDFGLSMPNSFSGFGGANGSGGGGGSYKFEEFQFSAF